jgi:hypothetical protein
MQYQRLGSVGGEANLLTKLNLKFDDDDDDDDNYDISQT